MLGKNWPKFGSSDFTPHKWHKLFRIKVFFSLNIFLFSFHMRTLFPPFVIHLIYPPSVSSPFFSYSPPRPPSHWSLSSLSKGQGTADISKPVLQPRARGMLIVCNLTQCLSSATQTGQSNHPETNTMNVSITHIEISVTL